MLIVVYIHGMPEPLAREICDLNELKDMLVTFGSQRIEKFTVMDFRPVKKTVNGEEKEICPDF